MNRLVALALAAGLAACSQNAVTAAVSLPGPNSLAVAGRTLLVANTASDELRALDLSPTPRVFVRAPNPLYPLAIPTAPFPRSLAARVLNDGSAPAFSFALSTAGAQVTVVNNATLVSIGAVAVPDTSLAIATTAPATAGADERLVVAATQNGAGSLYSATFAGSLASNPAGLADVKPALAVTLGASVPQVLVASPANPDLVAVGDRQAGPDGMGRQGAVAICNLGTGGVVRVDVGGPVRALSFNPTGDRLYGLLDTEACGTERVCGGLLGIDLTNPDAPSLLGVAALPTTAQGLAVSADIVVTLPSGDTLTVNPLVMYSAVDGLIYAFDGAAMQFVDITYSAATSLVVPPTVTAFYRRSIDGSKLDYGNGPIPIDQTDPANPKLALTLKRGVVRSEDFSLTWEGALVRGRVGVPVPGGLDDSAFDFAGLGAKVGDLVEFSTPGSCTLAQATIAAISGSHLDLGSFDTGCLPATSTYSVRVPKAYLAEGSLSGYLGRMVADDAFAAGGISFQATNVDPTVDPTIVRDVSFVVSLNAGYLPFALPLGSTTSGLSMPGAVTFDPVNKLFYAAFTGGNAVVEIDPTAMRHGRSDLGIAIFH